MKAIHPAEITMAKLVGDCVRYLAEAANIPAVRNIVAEDNRVLLTDNISGAEYILTVKKLTK